ncbi:hypothetical protein CEXT_664251 [Caerostris extrusa]|uniref:Uncharacterized protein n=1 Tax=Caerostris extrusa TaxID=172846 RepID=A0AAV4SNA8_CAEEX|nr:hypothetical protein CEXT_664251 [Caerostris extrusa]
MDVASRWTSLADGRRYAMEVASTWTSVLDCKESQITLSEAKEAIFTEDSAIRYLGNQHDNLNENDLKL